MEHAGHLPPQKRPTIFLKGRGANFTGWDPEVARGLLEDAGPGADEVDGAKGRLGSLHGGGELGPRRHVAFLEYGTRTVLGVRGWAVGGGGLGLGRGNEVVGFRTQAEVGDKDVAAFGDESFGEAEVDSLAAILLVGRACDRLVRLRLDKKGSVWVRYQIQRQSREHFCPGPKSSLATMDRTGGSGGIFNPYGHQRDVDAGSLFSLLGPPAGRLAASTGKHMCTP
jgi:hypothetical protein